MYIAWIWLAPIAYFFAAYMKPAMPGGAWFQVSVCLSNHCCNVYATGVHTVHGHMHAVPKLHPSAICIYTGSYIYIQYILPVECDILAGLFVCTGTPCSDVDCPCFQCSRVHFDLCGPP